VDWVVYTGDSYDGNNLYAVDAATGEREWAFQTDDGVDSSPAVAGGTVYVGSHDYNLYAVDVATGDQEWAFRTDRPVRTSPTVTGGTVYAGSGDGRLYAVDAATGERRWAFDTGEYVQSSPTVMDRTVYVGSDLGYLYAVDAATGTQKWAFETGYEVNSSPTVADGTVYVGSGDNFLYAVAAGKPPNDTATPTPMVSHSPTPRTTAAADDTQESVPLAEVLAGVGVGLVGLTLAGLSYMRREEDSVSAPPHRCGYTYLQGSTADTEPQLSTPRRHCCVRPPLPDADRCGVHALPGETERKRDALREISSVGPVLDGAILPGSVADEVNLSGVTHLRDADLSGAALDGADFSGVNLRGTDLSGADLTDADLSRSDLTGVDFSDTTLTATNVMAATLRETRVIDHHGEQTDPTKQILHNLGAITDSF
jgi:FOG: WD40-like repeat